MKIQVSVEQHSVRIRRAATIACVMSATSMTMKPRAVLVRDKQTQSFMRTDRGADSASAGLNAAVLWGSGKECKDIQRNSV